MYKNGIPAHVWAEQEERSRWRRPATDALEKNRAVESGTQEEQVAQERERYLRLAADFENFRKRISRELEQKSRSQKDALIRDLLPAVDNLERALEGGNGPRLREGVQMVYDQFVAVLTRHGLTPREDLGQPFDPRVHEGMAVAAHPDRPEETVVAVWERGWMRGEELFRPAKVVVNHLEEPQSHDP